MEKGRRSPVAGRFGSPKSLFLCLADRLPLSRRTRPLTPPSRGEQRSRPLALSPLSSFSTCAFFPRDPPACVGGSPLLAFIILAPTAGSHSRDPPACAGGSPLAHPSHSRAYCRTRSSRLWVLFVFWWTLSYDEASPIQCCSSASAKGCPCRIPRWRVTYWLLLVECAFALFLICAAGASAANDMPSQCSSVLAADVGNSTMYVGSSYAIYYCRAYSSKSSSVSGATTAFTPDLNSFYDVGCYSSLVSRARARGIPPSPPPPLHAFIR